MSVIWLRGTPSAMSDATSSDKYLHWDKLRHTKSPPGLTSEEWWFCLKLVRDANRREVPLKDVSSVPFSYAMPDVVQETLYRVDQDARGRVDPSEQILNPETRDRYLVSSLIELGAPVRSHQRYSRRPNSVRPPPSTRREGEGAASRRRRSCTSSAAGCIAGFCRECCSGCCGAARLARL